MSSAPEPGPPRRPAKPYRIPALEIVGSRPGSGKTRLLYQIAAEALLAGGGGGGGVVVWVDADGHFDYETFRPILTTAVAAGTHGRESATHMDAAVAAHLRHLHVFRPQSSQALVATVEGLQGYVLDGSAHASMVRPLRAVVVSGLSAFYWQDRREEREAGPEHLPPVAGLKPELLVERWRAIVAALKVLQARLDCVVVASNVALYGTEVSAAGPHIKSHLPAVWNTFVTLRLLVFRNTVTKFSPDMSAEEALREAAFRKDALRESGFTAWIERADDKTAETADPPKARQGERFPFQIELDKILVKGS